MRHEHLKFQSSDRLPADARVLVGEGEALETQLGAAPPARDTAGDEDDDYEEQCDHHARWTLPDETGPLVVEDNFTEDIQEQFEEL